MAAVAAAGWFVEQKVLRRFGMCLLLQYLLNSFQRSAFSNPIWMEAVCRNSVAGFERKRVTKWSLFRDEVANGFEGGGLLSGLGRGWYLV
ncbi:MAG: hypothetical protein K8L97_23660 [Anaerolineae bacterium]|nr:hypothetical protein [Anaerolineae bacterium]